VGRRHIRFLQFGRIGGEPGVDLFGIRSVIGVHAPRVELVVDGCDVGSVCRSGTQW
jgi:hypothetical protein